MRNTPISSKSMRNLNNADPAIAAISLDNSISQKKTTRERIKSSRRRHWSWGRNSAIFRIRRIEFKSSTIRIRYYLRIRISTWRKKGKKIRRNFPKRLRTSNKLSRIYKGRSLTISITMKTSSSKTIQRPKRNTQPFASKTNKLGPKNKDNTRTQ